MTIAYPVDPVMLDRPEKSEADRGLCLELLYEQCKQVLNLNSATPFFCPCGRHLDPLQAFKCYECHIWFCPSCAGRHFGFNREGRAAAPGLRPACAASDAPR